VKRAAAVCAVLTGSLAAVTASWAALDYLGVRPVIVRELAPLAQQVASNTRSLQLQRWPYLAAKARAGGLTIEERAEFCALSRLLGFQVAGCR
jgi:hypothetical protein